MTARLGWGAALIGACALSPLVLRAALIVEKLGRPGWVDVGGGVSDLAVAAGFAVVVAGLARASRWLAALALAFWALVHYANYENALALDSLAAYADLRFLGDETFARGSALWISSPALLAGLAAAGAGLGLWLAPRASGGASAGLAGVVALLGFALHASWMTGQLAVGWRYADFLQVNAIRLVEARLGGAERTTASAAMTDRLPELRANLDGEPITPLPAGPRRNVLLVFVEGLSGGFIPQAVEAHRTLPGPVMPRLQARAPGALAFWTFVAHQRRTNRGLYSGLCGELPNLQTGVPKMTAYLDGGTRECLPAVLRRNGYHTVYLQAAPLAFMLKDQFMPLAGFEEVHGHDWFRDPYVRSVWGVDDRTFFEQSLGMVDRLRESGEPWFLTLLTVGTHHPTIIPPNFETHRPIRFARALSYADQALDAFLEGLAERGVFEDTLVVLTSDESRGIPSRRDETSAALTQNWGVLLAWLPEGTRGERMEPYGLMDVALSIVDYLGLAEQGRHFFGRSLFRSYPDGRHLFFGNTNLRIVGAIAPDGSLVYCTSNLAQCRGFGVEAGRVFGTERRELELDPARARLVGDIAERSLAVQQPGVQPRVYELLMSPEFRVLRRHASLIHGGQYVHLKPNQWLEVEFEVDVSGGRTPLVLEHYLSGTELEKRKFTFNVRSGETLRFRYSYAPTSEQVGVRCRSFARLGGSEPADLHFRRARMTIYSVGERPEDGILVLENEKRLTGG